ncbi:hypothetical protein E4U54_003199, partial [Claviceps lovelessii]
MHSRKEQYIRAPSASSAPARRHALQPPQAVYTTTLRPQMNHLPSFQDQTRPYPPVPYVGSDTRPEGRFHDIPGHRGWRLEDIQRGDVAQGHGEDDTTAFYQDWLYFGLLGELSVVAGSKGPRRADFVVEQGGLGEAAASSVRPWVVSGKKLDGFIRTRVLRIAKMGEAERAGAAGVLGRALDTASRVTDVVWGVWAGQPAREAILVSAMVLGSSVDSGLRHVVPLNWQDMEGGGGGGDGTGTGTGTGAEDGRRAVGRRWRLGEVAAGLMAGDGWCRRDIAVAEGALCAVSL